MRNGKGLSHEKKQFQVQVRGEGQIMHRAFSVNGKDREVHSQITQPSDGDLGRTEEEGGKTQNYWSYVTTQKKPGGEWGPEERH